MQCGPTSPTSHLPRAGETRLAGGRQGSLWLGRAPPGVLPRGPGDTAPPASVHLFSRLHP